MFLPQVRTKNEKMTEENNENNGNNEITLNSILLTAREIFQTVLKNILLWLLDEEHKTLATGVEGNIFIYNVK